MKILKENNTVIVAGDIASCVQYSHSVASESFFRTNLRVLRASGAKDIIPILFSERLPRAACVKPGLRVAVSGQFRSYNPKGSDGRKLELFVFANSLEVDSALRDTNKIAIDGFICKQPTLRATPGGRVISDLLLAVNRVPLYWKTDYIPCVVWGRNAEYASELNIGTQIVIVGRIQSREYIEKLDDGTQETRAACEVSANRIDVMCGEEE